MYHSGVDAILFDNNTVRRTRVNLVAQFPQSIPVLALSAYPGMLGTTVEALSSPLARNDHTSESSLGRPNLRSKGHEFGFEDGLDDVHASDDPDQFSVLGDGHPNEPPFN